MERRRAAGKPAPLLDALEPLPDHLSGVWAAFLCLHAARTGNGAGPNPIAVSEILATADFFCLTPEEAVYHIQALDRIVLEEHAKRVERERQRRSTHG